ncbi:MAG TPA: cytochrome c3 family protein [Syntrophorhabdaceae bacterium]|nr:cytochrome c3 family protein [Syntrophorhabdaceae bacterium]
MKKAETRREPEENRKKRALSTGYLWLVPLAVLFGLTLYLYFSYGRRIGDAQPVSFSHRVHAGVKGINCRFCHPNVERSQHAGLPAVEKCFFCHKYIIPNHPEIKREEQYFRSGTPTPWKQVFWVPDFVFFNHVPHLKWGKLDCMDCHGDVKSMDRLQKVDFKMGFCLACHRKKNAQHDCWLACHR